MHCILTSILLFAARAPTPALSPADVAAIRSTLDQYVAAWLAGDSNAVMRQLTPDSVLIPGDKLPYAGADAIRAYWWPAGAPPFVLHRFTTTIRQIEGSADWAIVRGTQILEWTNADQRWRTRGNYITVLRRTRQGWRIAMQMASNSPNERIH
jgi:uncharacterized protein (TIGR02246 family)